nr:hypothetical protein [Tanacetum cinerariifolium]
MLVDVMHIETNVCDNITVLPGKESTIYESALNKSGVHDNTINQSVMLSTNQVQTVFILHETIKRHEECEDQA